MSAPRPVQSPEQRAAEVATMREAEARAMEELKANPMGTRAVPTSVEDVELLAMLAGSTAQEMRKARFADNVIAPTAATAADPKSIVSEFVKTAPGPIPGAVRAQPGRPANIPGAVAGQPAQQRDPNDPQLQLDLFKSMNMTDVYNMLDTIRNRLASIEGVQKHILEFMRKVENA